MKAFVLCSGLGKRLRPFTYSLPKASMPFLNLPLLSYGWFYLEQMGVSQFVLNSYLFPERLKEDVEFLKSPSQTTDLVLEEKLLDSGGGFYEVRDHFKNENEIFYLNGDSLFFPSDLNLLKQFKEDFIQNSFESSFFGVAEKTKNFEADKGYLWVDKDFILRGIGSENEMLSKGFSLKRTKDVVQKELRPVQFSGLALFKPLFLKSLAKDKSHIFWDVMQPHLSKGKYKVFVDEQGVLLEGGDEQSYLQASELCLKSLFLDSSQTEIKSILEKVFSRFDPEDKKVGLQFGKSLSQKLGVPLLAPSDLRGQEHLTVEGFAVLGSQVSIIGKSFLKRSVLGNSISWRGDVTNKILIQSSHFPDCVTSNKEE